MKGYRYYHKRKNIKLRFFFLTALVIFLLYLLINNISNLPFLQFGEKKVETINKMIKRYDGLTDRYEKKIVIQKALKNLLKLAEEKNNNYAVLFLLGEAYLRKGLLEYNKDLRNMYIDKSIYFLRKALALYKGDNRSKGRIHFELGRAYFYKGEYYYYESLMELNKAKKYGYKNSLIDKLIAFVKFRKGNFSEINDLINNFKNDKEGSVEKYFYNGYLLKNKGEYEKAKENFEMVEVYFQTRPPKNEEEKYILMKTYYALGWLYYNKDDYEKSLTYYKMALDFDKSDANIYYWMGKVYIKLNKYKEAKKMFKEVLKLEPENRAAKLHLKKLKKRRGR